MSAPTPAELLAFYRPLLAPHELIPTGALALVYRQFDAAEPPTARGVRWTSWAATAEDVDELVERYNRLGAATAFGIFLRRPEARGVTREDKPAAARWCAATWALVADLDVGEGKAHPTRFAALRALVRFIRCTGIRPFAVLSSGGGIHVWILLDEPLPYVEHGGVWRELMLRLALALDGDRSIRPHMGLRPPAGLHLKDATRPRSVRFLRAPDGSARVSVERLGAVLPPLPVEEKSRTSTPQPLAPLLLSEETTAYGRGALEDECRNLAGEEQGGRHAALFLASLKVGSLIAGGEIAERDAWDALRDAAWASGMESHRAREIEKAIRDGLAAGATQPRRAPTRDLPPPPTIVVNGSGEFHIRFGADATRAEPAPETDPIPRVPFAEAEQALKSLISEAIEHALAGGFAVVEPPCGLGKTRDVLRRLREDPAFAFVGFSFDDLAEKEAEAAVPVWTREGIRRACRFGGAAELAAMAGLMRRWRESACNGYGDTKKACPHRAECKALQAAPEELPLFAPHAGLDYTGEKSLGERVVVIDEMPEPLELVRVPFGDVASARYVRPRMPKHAPTKFAGWSEVLRHVEALGLAARDALAAEREELIAAGMREAEFPLYLDGPELAATWASYCARTLGAAEEVEQALELTRSRTNEVGVDRNGREWPFRMPSPARLRDLNALQRSLDTGDYPNLDVLDVLQAVSALASGPSEAAVIAYGFLSVVREPDGAARFELRRRKPYLARREDVRGIVLLSADAQHRLADVQAIAGGRPLRVFRLDVEPSADADCRRVYMEAEPTALSRTNLLVPIQLDLGDPLRAELHPRGVRALRKALARTARRARRLFGRRATCGLIVEKPIADAVRAALGGKALKWRAPEWAESWRAALREALGAVADDLDLAPERVLHFGAQRGRNTLAEVDVLVLFGAPVPNLGGARADGRALGVDAEQRWQGLVQAELYQAEGRARAIRPGRRTLIVAAGAWCPPGSVWAKAERHPLGRKASSLGEEAEAIAREHLAADHWTSPMRVALDLVAEGAVEWEGVPT